MIQQLMFGAGGFNAVTGTGQFVYVEHPSNNIVTLNYTAAQMTTWFNNRSLTIGNVPQSSSGTLTVNFNFTVPSGYQLYLVVQMSDQMNSQYSRVFLNGVTWPSFKSGFTCCNFLVANAGTAITELKFEGNVQYSGFNDGYVARVRNFVLVPTGSTVNSSWNTEADFTSNIPGAIITGV